MVFHKSILHLSVSSLLFLPLHWASGGGHSNTTRMLLELVGANILSTNHVFLFFFVFIYYYYYFYLSMMITTYAYFIRRYTRCHDFLSRSEGTCLILLLFRKEAQTCGDWFQKSLFETLITQHKCQSLI